MERLCQTNGGYLSSGWRNEDAIEKPTIIIIIPGFYQPLHFSKAYTQWPEIRDVLLPTVVVWF